MTPLVAAHRAEIAELCRRFHVQRLEVFGSAARSGDFDPGRSDVDFVVEFRLGHRPPSLETFFALRAALAAALGRPVDLVMADAVRNPYIRAEIDRSKEAVYAA